MLKGKQKKLDKNNNGRIDAEDFKLLKANKPMKAMRGKAVNRREETRKKQNPHSEYDKKGKLKYTAAKMGRSIRGYGAARTSGSGLMDEQMAPGKVINARVGKSIKKDPTKPISSVKPKVGAGAGSGAGRLAKAAKATKVGKIALGVAAIGMGAKKYLEKKRKEKEEMKKEGSMKSPFIPKKMGGGMMKRYSRGGGLDMGGPKGKIMQYIKDKKNDGERLTLRDKEFVTEQIKKAKAGKADKFKRVIDMAKKSIERKKAARAFQGFTSSDPMPKKMGGGMMMKPMGYTSGGDAKRAKPKKQEKIKYNDGPDLKPDADILLNRYNKKFSKYEGSKETELHSGYKNDPRPFPDLGEDRASKRAAKEVLQEAGIKFKSGGSIMAKGCKLGRKKKTKLY